MTAAATIPEAGEGSLVRRGLGLLGEMIRTHPLTATLSFLGASLFSIMLVGSTVVLGMLTDEVVIPALDAGRLDRTDAYRVGGLLVLVAIVRAVGVVFRRYFGAMTSRRMNRTWFHRLASHYLDQPLRFFLTNPTGRLLAHADADAETATQAFQPLPLSVGVVVLLIFASVSLAIVDPVLLLIGWLLFPLLLLMNRAFTRRVEDPSARAQAQVGAVSHVAHESFEGVLVVKLLGLERHERDRLDAEADRLRQERLLVGRLRAAFEPAIDALPNLGTVALILVGTARINSGNITTGELVQVMALFGVLAFPMRVVGFLLESMPMSVVARDRLVGVLGDDQRAEFAPVPHEAVARRPLPEGPLSIEADDLQFAYGANQVLDRLRLRADPGEIVALVGATGCGKTTLFHLLAGLIRPEGGEIRLGGVPLPDTDPVELRRAVALVFQETFLFTGTVAENLALSTDASDADISAAVRDAQAQFVDDLPHGMATVVGERGVTLSGGQRQRVALARALLRRPRLLLLDDATSAVDPVVEARILDGLRQRDRTTTIVVAHRVATIRLADRVLYMQDGTIAASGRHADLLASNEGYAALVRAYEEAEQ